MKSYLLWALSLTLLLSAAAKAQLQPPAELRETSLWKELQLPYKEAPTTKIVRLGIEKIEKTYYNYINLANKYFEQGQPQRACRVLKLYISPIYRDKFQLNYIFLSGDTTNPIDKVKYNAARRASDSMKPIGDACEYIDPPIGQPNPRKAPTVLPLRFR